MDALRGTVKPELGNQDILFAVSEPGQVLRQSGNFAWLQGRIELRNGKDPETKGTSFEEDAKEGIMDGFHVEALFQKKNGAWKVLEHGVGSTDVWWEGIETRHTDAPRAIFPWLDSGATDQSVAPTVRIAIMDGLRAVVKPEFKGQDIVFNVSGQGVFRVQGDWVWMQGKVQLRNGKDPSIDGTDFQTAADDGVFDGFHIEALLHKVNGSWTVVDHGVGSTDVWWDGLWDRHPDAPRGIFPMLDGK